MLDTVRTRSHIAAMLISASDDLCYIARCMEHYSADAQFFEHASELRGASALMRQWSEEMMCPTDIEPGPL